MDNGEQANEDLMDDIVITGIAGQYPKSHNVKEFMEHLLNKEDCCITDQTITHPEVPKNSGQIPEMELFDNAFFGVTKIASVYMETMTKLLLARTFEAILDAGLHPDDLRGSRTGVFAGTCYSDSGNIPYDRWSTNQKILNWRQMTAQRISYAFELNGPAYNCDTACSSGMYAFEEGYRAIREGRCDTAIVCASNIVFNQVITLQFKYLGVLNDGTGCRPFDDDATGYTRSSAVITMILQKAKNANRIYTRILHCKTNSDGHKDIGITFPSSECQAELLSRVLDEIQVEPGDVAFVEAHGTGTRVGDPEELNAIDMVFKPTQENPLLIGSIKGNIGHSEAASGLCSITKGIYMVNFDTFIPNIHYDKPRKDVPALMEGRMKVVTEVDKLPEEAITLGINCFGFGGANGNVILRKYEKKQEIFKCNIPKLVCVSGRTSGAIDHFHTELLKIADDNSCIRLIHQAFRKPFLQHFYRSYIILNGSNSLKAEKYCMYDNKKLDLVIGPSNAYDIDTLCEFLRIPSFKEIFLEVKNICNNNQILVSTNDKKSDVPQTVINSLVIQISLINLLINKLELQLSNIQGVGSTGKLLEAFAKNQINIWQVVLAACALNRKQPLETILDSALCQEIANNQYNNSKIDSSRHHHILVNIDAKGFDGIKMITPGSNVITLLEGLGQLYLEGFQPQIQNLYEDISLPVGRGTSFISPLIKWKPTNHRIIYDMKRVRTRREPIDLSMNKTKFYTGHVIDERLLFPATGYLCLAWRAFVESLGVDIYDAKVVFENVKFHKATHLDAQVTQFKITHFTNGTFEIVESNSIVATGSIHMANDDELFVAKRKDIDVENQEFVLTTKDIYKELRLRGYNYKGSFRAIHLVGPDAAMVKWEENWVTFLDNILQIAILQKDSRNLYVPVGIDRLMIDGRSHINEINLMVEDPKLVTIFCDRITKSLGTDCIEFRGIHARAIQKKRQRLHPILECHKFIPNHFKCSIDVSTRINIQLLLDCCPILNFKSVESPTDLKLKVEEEVKCISSYICEALADLPLVIPHVSVVSEEKELEIENITVINAITKDNLLYVGPLSDLDAAFNATNTNGFVMAVGLPEEKWQDDRFNILTVHEVENCIIYFMRKKQPDVTEKQIVDISKFKDVDVWLPKVQKAMAESKEVIVVAQNETLTGIMGFINCLRREPNGTKARCVFSMDEDANFDLNDPFYRNQLEKGMPNNILMDGQWGTYKHLLLPKNAEVSSEHVYANCQKFGDLSTLKWFQGPLKPTGSFKVAYSALNFKDLMLAYGKITADAVSSARLTQEAIHGLEFSGYNDKGQEILGCCNGAIANLVPKTDFYLKSPKGWSLEDGATVIVVYGTCLYGLVVEANIRKGQSILIHSACGGIGLAAINICTYYECEIFVTVGTEEKREYLLKNHPNIKKEHIGNSRDTSFREMIMRCTKGHGVDIVLNSLADEKLKASMECVARGGSFVEIGKFDMEMNTQISIEFSRRDIRFIAILLDTYLERREQQQIMQELIQRGVEEGFIKPLPRTVFPMNELEKAFRFMSTGKHIGKILIKIDDEAKELPAAPKYYCSPEKSYIVIGGMGGFGLELVDWLILRGAKNVVVSSRNGPQSGYQKYRLALWKNYNINVSICTEDVLVKKGCEKLILEASKLGSVDGIFNLAVVLQDCILENQTVETMRTSYGPKALLTQHLDELSRTMCPELRHFVVFSSVSCGRGNGGQTNYGYSNSVMERICELRRKDNLPAHAIQWGAVGDVGLLEELQKESNEIAIGGTLQQKIANCLEVFDQLIQQDETILSSIIVAEKFGRGGADNPVEAVARILGLKNIKSISMHAPLTELGMDSMMGVEIKQTLERDFDIVLNANDIRTLTFAKLEDIANGDLQPGSGEVDRQYALNMIAPTLHLIQSTEKFLTINEDSLYKIIGFPGVEGTPESFTKLAKFLNVQINYPHYNLMGSSAETFIDETATEVFNAFKDDIVKNKTFKVLSHSFGCLSALKFVHEIETKLNIQGILILIDSAPLLMKEMIKLLAPDNVNDFEAHLIEFVITKLHPKEDRNKLKEYRTKMQEIGTFEERLDFLEEKYTLADEEKATLRVLAACLHRRFYSVTKYNVTCLEPKLKSKVFLYKPKMETIMAIANDYDLSKWCEKVTVKKFDGNHQSVLESEEMFRNLKADFNCGA